MIQEYNNITDPKKNKRIIRKKKREGNSYDKMI